MKQPLIQKLDQLATDRWARRGVRTLLRAAWLSVCIWCIALGGHMLWGWSLRMNVIAAVALAILGGAVVLLLRPRLAPRMAAARLDRRFHLDEQLATAVEVAATAPPPGSIAARLVMESSHTAELLHRRITRHQRPPWQDILTLAALSLVAIGLWIISGVGFPNLAGSPLPLPSLASAQDPAQQLPQEPQAPDQSGQTAPGDSGQPGQNGGQAQANAAAAGDPQVIQALADALRDQGATRPAADALDRGDLAGAAQQLRELADQASQLSQSARDDLADSLENAAQQIQGSDPELADQLEQSADGLRQGDQDAATALDDLARAIEQLPQAQEGQQTGQDGQVDQQGQQPGQDGSAGQEGQGGEQGQSGQSDQQGQGDAQGNGTGAGSGSGGEQRQAAPNDRLGVEGQAVPLESNGAGDVPAQASDKPPTPSGANANGGFTQGGASSSQRVQVGDDPLRVPIDERDVVQGYFQPQN